MNETPKTKREPRRAALVLFLCCLSALVFALDARAQQAPAPTKSGSLVQIIPAPKSLKQTGEDFALGRGARVVLADAKSEDDRFAAQDFADDLKETAGVSLKVGAGPPPSGRVSSARSRTRVWSWR
jgi:hypothetical protein